MLSGKYYLVNTLVRFFCGLGCGTIQRKGFASDDRQACRYNRAPKSGCFVKQFYSVLITFAFACGCSAEDTASVAVGAFYINGEYGTDTDTTMQYVPLTIAYRNNGLRLSATASFLSIEGPPGNTAGVIDGNGALPMSGKAEGAGDSLLKASYDISTLSRCLLLRPQLKIKIPTADENQGLGTGATDYTTQVDAFYFVHGWWPYLSAGYRWRGDGSYSIDDGTGSHYPIDLENGLILGAGFYKPLTAASSLTVGYEHRAPSIVHLAATEELLATYQRRFDSHWLATFSAGTGFTARSADRIAGVQLEYRY
jgi:hypothetical protein